MGIIKAFFFSFFSLAVAIDVIGTLPVFMAVTGNLKQMQKEKVVRSAAYTAFLVMVGVMVLSRFIIWIMGIKAIDLKIAGGMLLFILSLYSLLGEERYKRYIPDEERGLSLGTMLLIGPAVLTTAIILAEICGFLITILAFAGNMLVVIYIVNRTKKIMDFLGTNAGRIFSKMTAVILGLFAVMLTRQGILGIFRL